jgi:hypothetical protein
MPSRIGGGWRAAAGFLLVLEAMWWAANALVVGAGTINQSATAELLSVVSVALMFLALLAVFLLIQAPRAGVWMGLAMQGIVGVHALVLIFLTSLLGVFELALGVMTALCLAAAAGQKRRP